MRLSSSATAHARRLFVFICGVVAIGCAMQSAADSKTSSLKAPPDRFTATTTAMTPSGVNIRVDVARWSDDSARAAVVTALGAGGEAAKELAGLPTIGYVWEEGGGAGFALKYAQRTSTPQGERVTFVTSRRLGAFDFRHWTVDTPPAEVEPPYSVIELYLDASGKGQGTLSLAAKVEIDAAGSLVTLAEGAPRVLANAQREPKPYWATSGG